MDGVYSATAHRLTRHNNTRLALHISPRVGSCYQLLLWHLKYAGFDFVLSALLGVFVSFCPLHLQLFVVDAGLLARMSIQGTTPVDCFLWLSTVMSLAASPYTGGRIKLIWPLTLTCAVVARNSGFRGSLQFLLYLLKFSFGNNASDNKLCVYSDLIKTHQCICYRKYANRLNTYIHC